MKQEYYIKFNAQADSKGLDDLSRKSAAAKGNFEGLQTSIGGATSEVAKLTAGLLGVSGALSAAQVLKMGFDEAKAAKGNIVDFQMHEYGKQHMAQFFHSAKLIAGSLRLNRTKVEQAFYKAVQAKDDFKDENDIVDFVKMAGEFSRATGRKDVENVTDELIDLKRSGNLSTNGMREVLNQITYNEDRYKVSHKTTLEWLKRNLPSISSKEDVADYIHLQMEATKQGIDPDFLLKTFLSRRDEIVKGQDNSSSPLAKLVDKSNKKIGAGLEEWLNGMGDMESFKKLYSSVDWENPENVKLFNEIFGGKRAVSMKDKAFTDVDKSAYKDNLTGEVQKKDLGEEKYEKVGHFISSTAQDLTRRAFGRSDYDVFKEQKKDEIARLKAEGYNPGNINAIMFQQFQEETRQYQEQLQKRPAKQEVPEVKAEFVPQYTPSLQQERELMNMQSVYLPPNLESVIQRSEPGNSQVNSNNTTTTSVTNNINISGAASPQAVGMEVLRQATVAMGDKIKK